MPERFEASEREKRDAAKAEAFVIFSSSSLAQAPETSVNRVSKNNR
jgi:hypothetical protein